MRSPCNEICQSRDICGTCDGGNSSCVDCTGQLWGEAKEDKCGVCNGDGECPINIGIIVGPIVGFVVLVSAAGFFFYMHRRKTHYNKYEFDNEMSSSRGRIPFVPGNDIDFLELKLGNKIGSGAFGIVYKGGKKNILDLRNNFSQNTV